MTNLMEPRGAAYEDDGTDDGTADASRNESELASLVRRWMQAGSRGRRDGVLRLAPEPREEHVDELEIELEVAAEIAPEIEPEVVLDEPAGLIEAGESLPEVPIEVSTLRAPALPHRPTAEETEHATRLGVLIDARRVSEEIAATLLARLGDRGAVNVCRAYADWTRSDLGSWVGRMRQEGLHSFHQFADDDDQALVAMSIDAVDIAREAAVDEIVIAGDLTSMLPLVHRLHAAGVRVVLVGPGHTPHDVRGACDEFLLAESLAGEQQPVPAGRHRA